MDYDIGTKLLIQSPGNEWVPAVVEEDDGDEIFISYTNGNCANEWINKDSHRIWPMNKEWNLNKGPSESQKNVVSEVKPIENPIEKEVVKKLLTGSKSAGVFKVKFKKDATKTKKDTKHKESKTPRDSKKISGNIPKQQLSTNFTNDSKMFSQDSDNSKMTGPETNNDSLSKDLLPNEKPINETSNLPKSDNFEELLEDIEAEAEICSPTKSSVRSIDKQKKKRKKFFGQRKRPEKRPRLSKSIENKKNLLVVKLNPHRIKRKNTSTPHNSKNANHSTPPAKKLKLSMPSKDSVEELSPQTPTTFSQLANNMILQKIRLESANEQGFRCPKQECSKLFRKENLLMMHIKHYHSEYTDLLVSTPNVTDLATARIEGENVDDLSPSYFLHRISQLEAKKTVGNTPCDSPSTNMTPPSTLKFPELELDNLSFQSENLNSSYISNDKVENVTQLYESKDSGFSAGTIELGRSLYETYNKESDLVKEPIIKKIPVADTYENETHDSCDTMSVTSDRHYKIKKNKSEIESLRKEEVINCSCGSNQEDGLMIQCDVCLCWQHGFCNKIDSEDQVPDNYICFSCLNPSKKRRSKQYDYLQDWRKEGKIATVLQHKDERRKKDENILKQTHQLVAEVIEHNDYLHSLVVKTVIYGQTPDHPKLYLWSDQSSKRNDEPPPDKLEEILRGPVPEKPINTAECRKNLLDEMNEGFDNLEARIGLFESKVNGIEDQVNGSIDHEVLSNTVTMLLRDLKSIRHHLSLENKSKEATSNST